MGELDDEALEEARSRSETLHLRDLIEILELHRVDGGQGVTRETIDEYADALNYDPERADWALDEQVTDAHEWTADDDVYRLGEDRFSVYPPRWHEELADTTDLRKHVGLINASVTTTEGQQSQSVPEAGVPERKLLRVAQVISGMDREEARDRIDELWKDDELESPNNQHRDSNYHLPDRE